MHEANEALISSLFTGDAIAARIPAVPGARNLRDMGGYPASDGRRVRRGLLFRSGHPGDLTVSGVTALRRLGIRGHIDLRTTVERMALPFPAEFVPPEGSWARDYDTSNGDLARMLVDPAIGAGHMQTRMINAYQRFPVEQKAGFAAMFGMLLKEHAPILINCTAGKDRTGVASALLLSALGVPRSIVTLDYALTAVLHPPSARLFEGKVARQYAQLDGVDPAAWQALMDSPPAYLDAAFAAIDEQGGIAAYLAEACGVGPEELKRLRNFLLED